MKKLIAFFTLLLLLGCSNDNNSTNQEEQITDGGEIFTSQLVTIINNNINQDEYNATLGELSIKALQSGDNQIMFLVPINYNTGETIFEIPELGLKIKYNVNQPILNTSSEETIEPFIQNLTSFEQSLDDELDSFRKQNVLNSISLFEQKLADASDDEKRELAEFYFINKTMIDDIYDTDYTIALASRDYSNLDSFEAFNNFKVSVVKALAISGLSYLAFSIPSPDLFSKLLAAGTALIAVKCWYDSYDLFIECKERSVFTLDFLIGSYPSSLSGNENDIIIYSHGAYREDIVIRNANKINNSYTNSPISAVSDFFENLDVLGNIIWKINYVIDKINQYNPFSEIENIPNASLKNSLPNNINATDDILNNVSYSIDDSNVTIDEISFQDGIMKTKLSINDQDIVNGEYLDTNLNFQFQDEFNDIQGSYPIRINKENQDELVGTWTMIDNGISCQNNPSGWGSGTYVQFFSNGTLSWNGIISGTYTFNGNDLYFEFSNNQTNTYNCTDGSTLVSNYDMVSEFNGSFDGTSFNGNFSHIVTYTPNLSNCQDGDSNENCQGSMTLTQ